MKLRAAQSKFVDCVELLLNHVQLLGYEVTFGEAYRSPEEAARLAKLGLGIKNSLHCQKLAIDLNLFENGTYLSTTEAHRPLGEFWETLHPQCYWGGTFARSDGNHYEFGHPAPTLVTLAERSAEHPRRKR